MLNHDLILPTKNISRTCKLLKTSDRPSIETCRAASLLKKTSKSLKLTKTNVVDIKGSDPIYKRRVGHYNRVITIEN